MNSTSEQPEIVRTVVADMNAVSLPPTREERYLAGKALRSVTPRKAQAAWEPPPGRRDPVEILIESSEGRIPELVPIRYGRMIQTPFAFYRGAAAIMAADLAATPNSGIRVQASGDCHLANFGGFATPERRIVFDMNDFDETTPAPWEWDVKRLAASFVIAGRNNRFTPGDCRQAAVASVRSYRERMAEYAAMPTLRAWYSYIDFESEIEAAADPELRKLYKKLLDKAERRDPSNEFPKLAHRVEGKPVINDNPPLIYHLEEQKHSEWQAAMLQELQRYRESLPQDRQLLFDRYRFADAATKVVGVGSVGTHCAVALFFATDDDPLFLQIKEARDSVLEPYAGKSPFKNRGQRVVVGQRLMQSASDIFLGWTEGDGRRHFYFRQLRDVKIKPVIEIMKPLNLTNYAVGCGWALARAHSRSGEAGLLAGYMGKSDTFDEAIGDFAAAYADQNERDHAALVEALRQGRVEAVVESV
jgi:uncharacterized protein (DUF2252 family)